jgi:hypothetical protein
MSQAALNALVETNSRLILNVNPPRAAALPDERHRQTEVVEALTDRVTLGYTIERLPVDPAHHVELLRRGAGSAIRVGMALPHARAPRPPIPLGRLTRLGEALVQLGRQLSEVGGRLHLDCGFCRCMLSDQGIRELVALDAKLAFRCRPSVDIWPDLSAHPCYPLASWPVLGSIADREIVHQDLVEKLQELARLYRPLGLFEDCADCALRTRGDCDGGCLGSLRLRARPLDSTLLASAS